VARGRYRKTKTGWGKSIDGLRSRRPMPRCLSIVLIS